MASQDDGSVTRWIGDLPAGGDSAAQHFWERYFHRLVHLARARLRAARWAGAVADEEDAALSAFDSFCGAAAGRFPQLTDRDGLWRLLVVITLRKVLAQVGRQAARKRGGGRLVGESAIIGGEAAEARGLDRIAADEPGPEMAAMVVDEYRRLRDRLGSEPLRQVLDLRLQGYTREEIADRVGCAERTVRRKLELIREAWLQGEA
jgi:DNA-directed RNA polymerase specialized sigma24 family protein